MHEWYLPFKAGAVSGDDACRVASMDADVYAGWSRICLCAGRECNAE